jgi:hypothetical protein
MEKRMIWRISVFKWDCSRYTRDTREGHFNEES